MCSCSSPTRSTAFPPTSRTPPQSSAPAPRPRPAGSRCRWKWAALAVTFIVLLNPVFLPYGALLNAAFSPVASQFVTFGTLTLHNIEFVFFELSATKLAFENTLILCTAAATIGTVMAVVIAYMTPRKVIALRKALGLLPPPPGPVPGVRVGVGPFLRSKRPPLVLYFHPSIM